MSAAFERAGRTFADGVAKAFTIALEEGRYSNFAKTIADSLPFAKTFTFAESHADSINLVAEAVADTEEFANAKAFSLVEA